MTIEELTCLAEISALDLNKDEMTTLSSDMDNILSLMNTISDFQNNSTDNLKKNTDIEKLRKDLPISSDVYIKILKGSDRASDGYFTVPQIVE